jgi:general secretion pathway protein L
MTWQSSARKIKGALLPQASFRLFNGQAEPTLRREWQAALRGSRIDVVMRSDQLLFRTIDFPKAAADFLDSMVRAQIDRLTPWSVADAVFGMTTPEPIAGERIVLTVAATSQQKIQPLLRFAPSVDAASVAVRVDASDAAAGNRADPGLPALAGKRHRCGDRRAAFVATGAARRLVCGRSIACDHNLSRKRARV